MRGASNWLIASILQQKKELSKTNFKIGHGVFFAEKNREISVNPCPQKGLKERV